MNKITYGSGLVGLSAALCLSLLLAAPLSAGEGPKANQGENQRFGQKRFDNEERFNAVAEKLGLTPAFDFRNDAGERTGVYLHVGGRNFVELFQGAPAARDDAQLILTTDPDLVSPRGQALRTLLYLFECDEAARLFRAA